jgi:hypothetical protein
MPKIEEPKIVHKIIFEFSFLKTYYTQSTELSNFPNGLF